MLELIDSFIWHHKINDSIKKIINDIYQRKLPKLVYQDISLHPCEFNEEKLKENFDINTFEIIRFTVGYVGGKSNPLNHIMFYDLHTNTIIPQKKVRDFSLLLNQKHQEYIIRIYCIDLALIDIFKLELNKLITLT